MYILLLSLLYSLQISDSSRAISGTVTNMKGEPLHQASVIVEGYQIIAFTDKDGYYQLSIPDSLFNGVIEVRYAYPGMADKHIRVKQGSTSRKEINVKLKDCLQYLEITIVPRTKKESRQRVKEKRRFERMNPCH